MKLIRLGEITSWLYDQFYYHCLFILLWPEHWTVISDQCKKWGALLIRSFILLWEGVVTQNIFDRFFILYLPLTLLQCELSIVSEWKDLRGCDTSSLALVFYVLPICLLSILDAINHLFTKPGLLIHKKREPAKRVCKTAAARQNVAPRHAAVGAKPHQGQNFAPSYKSWVLKNTDLQGNLCFKAFHGKHLPKRHVCPLVLWVPQSRKSGNHSDIPELFDIICCLNFMLWSGF